MFPPNKNSLSIFLLLLSISFYSIQNVFVTAKSSNRLNQHSQHYSTKINKRTKLNIQDNNNNRNYHHIHIRTSASAAILSIRGGKEVATSTSNKTKTSRSKKKKQKKKRSTTTQSLNQKHNDSNEAIETGKSVIKDALKEDAATAMGDAIRARSSDLLNDDLTHPLHHVDVTLNSISYAIGSSEIQQRQQQRIKRNQAHSALSSDSTQSVAAGGVFDDDGGGVEPSSSAVIANYFLKSHGGLHGIQSIMSLLSVFFGLGTYAVPSNNLSLKVRLIQRTLICALSKHLSGFIAAATASANRIPDVGFRETRIRIENLALDPVTQYLFYCALLVLWMNGININMTDGLTKGTSTTTKAATATLNTKAATDTITSSIIPWWLNDKRRLISITCLIGPILIREIVSTIWVIADVLVLHHSSNLLSSSSNNSSSSSMILKIGKRTIDAFMSLLLTPATWRNANAAQRQRLLAKLVAKISLSLEIGTGLILIVDAIRAFLDFSISPVKARPSFISVSKRLVCARLYINFLLVRRKKVIDLVKNIRGGFVHVPGRVLDTMLQPGKAMGLDWEVTGSEKGENDDDNSNPKTLFEWAAFLAGF